MSTNGLISQHALSTSRPLSRQLQTQTDDPQAACAASGGHPPRLTTRNPFAQSLARAQRQQSLADSWNPQCPCPKLSDALRHARPGSSLPAMRDSMSSPVTSEVHCGSRSRRSLPVMLWPSLTLHCLLQQTARIREVTVSMSPKDRLQWKKASAFWPAASMAGMSSRATSAILPGMRRSLAP